MEFPNLKFGSLVSRSEIRENKTRCTFATKYETSQIVDYKGTLYTSLNRHEHKHSLVFRYLSLCFHEASWPAKGILSVQHTIGCE